MEGLDDIHHFLVWSLDEETIALDAHVVANIETFDEMESIKNIIKKKLSDEFNIKHSTLEFEHEMMC